MKIRYAEKSELKFIEDLYLEAFPENERKPFSLILKKVAEKSMEILVIETDRPVGLAITVLYKDMVLLDYFAVSLEYRGKGYGALAIKMLENRYVNKRFFLEIEYPDSTAENNLQRIRRKDFYLKNCLSETNICILLFGVKMEILTYKCSISFNEYKELYLNVFDGKIQVQLIEN